MNLKIPWNTGEMRERLRASARVDRDCRPESCPDSRERLFPISQPRCRSFRDLLLAARAGEVRA